MTFQKLKITAKTLEILNPSCNKEDFDKALREWWMSSRIKPQGGLRLTPAGYSAMVKAGLTEYRIQFEKPFNETPGRVAIWMDQLIDCPFYFSEKELRLFGEHMAIQLVLFYGNILKFGHAKKRKQKTT